VLCGVLVLTMNFGSKEASSLFLRDCLRRELGFEQISSLTDIMGNYFFLSLHAIIRVLYESK